MARKNRERKVREPQKDYHETHAEGCLRELLVAMKLIERGYQVSRPIGTTYRYDLIAEKHPKYYRIQVKNLKLAYRRDPEEPLSIDQWEIRAYTIANGKKKTYSIEDADLIFAINVETKDFAIIPVDCIPTSGIVRISEKTDRGCYLNSFLALDEE